MIVQRLVLDVDGKKVELTVEQAQKLKDELNALFGGRVDYIPVPYIPYSPPMIWYSNQVGESVYITWLS